MDTRAPLNCFQFPNLKHERVHLPCVFLLVPFVLASPIAIASGLLLPLALRLAAAACLLLALWGLLGLSKRLC